MTTWDQIGPLANEKRKPAIARLTRACKRLNLEPDFTPAQRDLLRDDLETRVVDPKSVINRGLKALRAIRDEHGLPFDVCAKIPSPRQEATAIERASYGPVLTQEVSDYISAQLTPTDQHGRARKVIKDVERRDTDTIYRMARICRDAGHPVSCLADLTSETARNFYIAHYGDSAKPSGGRKDIFKVLKRIGRHTKAYAALVEIERQVKTMGKCRHDLPQKTRRALMGYEDARLRDEALNDLFAVAARIGSGWPASRDGLARIQGALSCLLAYFLSAVPAFVRSVHFDPGVGMRTTRWGSRPSLRADKSPGEDIEARLPPTITTAIDLYWAQMPPADRQQLLLFTYDGKALSAPTFAARQKRTLDGLGITLSPLGLVDLWVFDATWDKNLKIEQMALATRFASDEAFLKRYKAVIEGIRSRQEKGGRRPRSKPINRPMKSSSSSWSSPLSPAPLPAMIVSCPSCP